MNRFSFRNIKSKTVIKKDYIHLFISVMMKTVMNTMKIALFITANPKLL